MLKKLKILKNKINFKDFSLKNIFNWFILKFKKMQKFYKSNRNYSIILFIFIYLVGYGLFITSRSWIYTGDKITKYTDINTVITIDNRELKLVKWTYCESSSAMEVEIDINNTNFDGINDFIFTANDKSGKRYKVDTIIVSPTLSVVQIKGVKKQTQIRLTMQVNYGTQLSTEIAKFYTNYNQVEKVNEIITYNTMDEYYIARLDRYIADYNIQINDLQNKVEEQTKRIDSYNSQLTDLNIKKNYVAADELVKVEKEITDTKNGINECNNKISELNNSIMDIQKKIENTEAIKEVYK